MLYFKRTENQKNISTSHDIFVAKYRIRALYTSPEPIECEIQFNCGVSKVAQIPTGSNVVQIPV